MIRCPIKFRTKTWWKIILSSTFVMMLLSIFEGPLGMAEGYLNPVVVDTKISKIKDDPAMAFITFWGSYTKIRDCPAVRYEWFYIDEKRSRHEFAVNIVNRDWRFQEPGVHNFGPRIAYISPELLLNNSIGYVTHDCHPFFLTRSLFWKGAQIDG